MSFLKKLGIVLGQITATAIGIGPILTPLFGSGAGKVTTGITTVTNDLTAIATLIAQIEVAFSKVPNATGEQKFEAAVALVTPMILTSQMISKKKIADPVKLALGIREVTQGMVDILNSVHEDSIKEEIKLT